MIVQKYRLDRLDLEVRRIARKLAKSSPIDSHILEQVATIVRRKQRDRVVEELERLFGLKDNRS
jgi:hypothetical protein